MVANLKYKHIKGRIRVKIKNMNKEKFFLLVTLRCRQTASIIADRL